MLCQIDAGNTKEKYLERLTNIEIKLVSNLKISISFENEKHIVNYNYFIESKDEKIIVFYLNIDITNQILENNMRQHAKELAKHILFDLKDDKKTVFKTLFQSLYSPKVNDISSILADNKFTMQKCVENHTLPGRILLEEESLDLFLIRSEFEINEMVIYQETTNLTTFLTENVASEE
ncbi:unnamed protein product [Dimorphilus gyrociliatus]|uniref:Uncharacterized protein n=1 Tax=Dimorphilus gyrociliatus TaxID=2664684 RepID=A0A7I8WFC6_9ANNE|nr:unnamed protein product [Dimorphilus gyrociliatus]